MSKSAANPYLKTKVLTASPEELRLMLYEGAIKFCRQGHDALERRDFEASYGSLARAQKIILELSTSLNEQVAPELCAKLSALYTYIYRLLVDANVSHGTDPLDEAIERLSYEKQTWEMLMASLPTEGKMPSDIDRSDVGGAQQAAISSTSNDGQNHAA